MPRRRQPARQRPRRACARIVKVFMDGVVNAPADTGSMRTPCVENAGTEAAPRWVEGTNSGPLYFAPTVLQPLVRAAVDAGLDMHLHTTGDRGVRTVLDAVQATRVARPKADFRPAAAHAETVAVADCPRFKSLDTSVTMSLQWAQRAANARARVMSAHGWTGHAMPAHVPGAPHAHGDGHNH